MRNSHGTNLPMAHHNAPWINLLLYMLIVKVEISIKLTLVRRSGRV